MTPSQLGQSCADSEGLEEALEVNERNQIRLPGSKASLDGAGGSRSGRSRTTGELLEILKNYTMKTGVCKTTLRASSCVVVRTKSENAGDNPDK
jgi:hypothetical protein